VNSVVYESTFEKVWAEFEEQQQQQQHYPILKGNFVRANNNPLPQVKMCLNLKRSMIIDKLRTEVKWPGKERN